MNLQESLKELESAIFAPTTPDEDMVDALEKVKSIIDSIHKELNALEKMDLILASSYRDNEHLDSAQYHAGRAKAFAVAAEHIQNNTKNSS